MSEFGVVLRDFRRAAGLSQEKLAEASGVSVEAVKTLEAGRRKRPRPFTVQLLSRGLGLDAEQAAELSAAVPRSNKASSESPYRIPDDVADFVGRADQVTSVTELLSAGGDAPGVLVISAIAGMGGVGKTALAVHAAHEVAERFPDGQLYLNLRGFGPGEPMRPLEAVTALLQALDVRLDHVPGSVDDAAALFRSACAGRRLLLVLDNVAGTEQIAGLLPGASTCAVVITSRRVLTAVPGARHLLLDVLPEDESLELLAAAAGAERIAADPVAAADVVKLCGALPLALRIAGTRLASEPDWTVGLLRRKLADETNLLDVLTDAHATAAPPDGVAVGSGVRASIAMSLSALAARDRAAVDVFRLLGLYDGDEFDVRVAARIADRPVDEIGPVLETLVDLHLLESADVFRYRFHDLVRAYARELAADVPEADRRAARLRMLSLYAGFAWRARTRNGVGALSADWFDQSWAEGTEDLDSPAALRWLDLEADEIITAADRVVQRRTREELVLLIRIAVGMVGFWNNRRRDLDGVRMGQLALALLEASPEIAPPQAVAMLSHDLAHHFGTLSEFGSAIEAMTISVTEAEAHGYRQHLLFSLTGLGSFLERVDRLEESRARTEAGLRLALELGDVFGESEARLGLGVLAGRGNDPAEQDRQFELADTLIRKAAPEELYWISGTVARSLRETGRAAEATRWLRDTIELLRAAAVPFAMVDLLWQLGSTEVQTGEFGAAVTDLEAALELVGGSWELEARIRHALGSAWDGLGERESAREQWQLALQLYTRHGRKQAAEVRRLLEG